MTGTEKLQRALLPTRQAQLRYHAELERALGVKIIRRMGRWELSFGGKMDRCERCDDSGFHIQHDGNGYEYATRCPCPAGERVRGPLFSPSDKDKKRPLVISTQAPRGARREPIGRERAAGKDE